MSEVGQDRLSSLGRLLANSLGALRDSAFIGKRRPRELGLGGKGSEQALRLSSLLFSFGFPHLPRYERTNVHALSPTSRARADRDEPWEEKRASPGHPDGEQGGLGEMQAGAR